MVLFILICYSHVSSMLFLGRPVGPLLYLLLPLRRLQVLAYPSTESDNIVGIFRYLGGTSRKFRSIRFETHDRFTPSNPLFVRSLHKTCLSSFNDDTNTIDYCRYGNNSRYKFSVIITIKKNKTDKLFFFIPTWSVMRLDGYDGVSRSDGVFIVCPPRRGPLLMTALRCCRLRLCHRSETGVRRKN